MKCSVINAFWISREIRRTPVSGLTFAVLLSSLLIAFPFAGEAISQSSSKPSSVVIHDTTRAGNGGENATKGLRDQIKAAMEREKPCIETMDDQDLRDAIQDEKERALLEGSDSTEALKQIGDRLGSSMVITVQAMPGPNGSVTYSAAGMDTRTARAVARGMGDEKTVAENLVRDLGPYLADTCKPHWTGSIKYVYSFNETKTKNDAGAAHAARRKTKRTLTETSNWQLTINASLQSSPSGSTNTSSSTPKARVSQRAKMTFTKVSSTTGEVLCREPGKNSYYKGFSEEYKEIMTQLGQGTDVMPVFISVDDDGSYSIKVNAPGGVLYAKNETTRNETGCDNTPPTNTIDAQDLPEGKFQGTSFEAEGRTNPKNKDSLTGSQTSSDGHTTITWSLRLVKPKGKN